MLTAPADKLVKKFRAKPVYIGGQLVYTVGMIMMAMTRSKYGTYRESPKNLEDDLGTFNNPFGRN